MVKRVEIETAVQRRESGIRYDESLLNALADHIVWRDPGLLGDKGSAFAQTLEDYGVEEKLEGAVPEVLSFNGDLAEDEDASDMTGEYYAKTSSTRARWASTGSPHPSVSLVCGSVHEALASSARPDTRGMEQTTPPVDPVFAGIAKALYGDVDPRELLAKFSPGGSDLHMDQPLSDQEAKRQKRIAQTGLAATGVAGWYRQDQAPSC